MLAHAVLFLYRQVPDEELPWLNEFGRPAQRRRIPTVLTKQDVASLLALMDVRSNCSQLLYGTGMHLMEGLSLRVKDVDFDRRAICSA
jgi:integrase